MLPQTVKFVVKENHWLKAEIAYNESFYIGWALQKLYPYHGSMNN